MKIYFTNIGAKRFLAKKVVETALKHLGQPSKHLEMSVSVVDEQQIAQLNKEFRNIDSVTDVLSFPTLDNPCQGVLNLQDFASDVNPDTGLLNVGDVVICLERAKQQATDYGHSLTREMAFLVLHGLLHLLGYDHVQKDDEQKMFAVQDEILKKLKIIF